jgi:hypothetical protein
MGVGLISDVKCMRLLYIGFWDGNSVTKATWECFAQ